MTARLLVAAALALTLLAYVALVRPLEARIAERYRSLSDERRTLGDEAVLTARIADAERERGGLAAALTPYQLTAPAAARAARFLDAAAASAARHGTLLGAVEAEPPATTGRTTPAAFAELPLRMTVRGAYPAVLATLRDLITAPVPLRLRLEALGPDPGARSRPVPLVATLHVVLYGLPEVADVRARSH